MSYYVYVLRSISTRRLYYGSCQNVDVRLQRHNNGKVISTKRYRPWEVIYTEQHASRSAARKRELQLKRSGVARKQLKEDPKNYKPPSSIG